MGVPKFFRWLSERYPALLTRVNEYDIPDVDNFYLDMNGIIHSCSHPSDDDINACISEAKVFEDVFAYIDTLVRIIKPRKLLFLAIDGVAPRAKMNQQRSRRFRAANAAEQQEMEARQRGAWKEVDETEDEKRFDSNTITPGTDFMCRLDEHLQYFVQRQTNEDPLWRRLTVIYSSHLSPGEGEHKIMDYIRFARSKNNYDIRTRHCLYGLDADLIMLGLATHEPYFTLLREEVKFGAPPKRDKGSTNESAPKKNKADQITFFLMHLSLLRDYLAIEFQDLKGTLALQFDIEAIIDDWVFMNMLVGNDFIPHLPFMHINKGSLQKFYEAYKRAIPEMGGYMNDHGTLIIDRFMLFIRHIAQAEEELMSEARDDDAWIMSKKRGGPIDTDDIWDDVDVTTDDAEFLFDADNDENVEGGGAHNLKSHSARMSAAQLKEAEEREFEKFASDIRYNYYKKKFCLFEPTDEDVKNIAHELVRALVWNLGYYYCGVQSWEWYYPYHYSPYASDIWRVCKAEQFRDVSFPDRGRPFMPFEQLMAVLPAQSKPCLPQKLRKLFDSDSPIYDFYPKDFLQDMDDKQNDWEAVVCVPFVDERRLVLAVASVIPHLSEAEKRRNTVQPSYIYTYDQTALRSVPSPNVRSLAALGACAVRVRHLSYEDILLPNDSIKHGLLIDGTSLHKYRKGYPQLNLIRFSAKIAPAGVKVFMHCSRGVSVLLKVLPPVTTFNSRPFSDDYDMKQQDGDDDDLIALNDFDMVHAGKNGTAAVGAIENIEARIDAEIDIGCEYLGRDMLVSWPYVYEARVERVINGKGNEQHVFDANDGMIKQIAYEEDAESFRRQMGALSMLLKEKLAIDIGDTCVALGVRRKIGYQLYYHNSGRTAQLQPQYEKELRLMPIQLCVPKSLGKLTTVEDDPVNACGFRLANGSRGGEAGVSSEGRLIDVKSIFTRNDLVFQTATPFYGAVGKALEVIEQQPAPPRPGAWGRQIGGGSGASRLMVQVKFLFPYEPDMSHVRQHYQHNLAPEYWGARELSQHLRMHPRLVSAITGTLLVVHSKQRGANIVEREKKRSSKVGNVLAGESTNGNDDEDDNNDAESDELDPVTIAGMRNNGYKDSRNGDQSSLKNVAKSNIGLNLKKNKTKKEVRGYSIKDVRTNQWLYSDRVGEMLSKWRNKYSSAVAELSKNLGADIRVDMLFPDEPDPMKALQEMRQFIKDLLPDTTRAEQTSGSEFIDDIGIAEIRKQNARAGPRDMYCFIDTCKPQNLFKFIPGINDNAPADSRPAYRLWDRVVNIRPNCAVPLGSRGTVTRVEYEDDEENSSSNSNTGGDFRGGQPAKQQNTRQRLLQVLWDEPFKVGGDDVDLLDVPLCFVMNWTFGSKQSTDKTGSHANVRMQRTNVTIREFVSPDSQQQQPVSACKKHKMTDEEDSSEEEKENKGAQQQSVSGGGDEPVATKNGADLLTRFLLRKPSGNNNNNSDNFVVSSSVESSECMLQLEAMIAAGGATEQNDAAVVEVDDDGRRAVDQQQLLHARSSSSEFLADDEPVIIPAETSLQTGRKNIRCETSETKMHDLLSLFHKGTADFMVQAKEKHHQAVVAAASDEAGAQANVVPFNAFLMQILVAEGGMGLGSRNNKRNTASVAKKDAGKSATGNNVEEWVNETRDDYFDGDQIQWQSPTDDVADNNAAGGGPSRRGGVGASRGGQFVRGSRGGRGAGDYGSQTKNIGTRGEMRTGGRRGSSYNRHDSGNSDAVKAYNIRNTTARNDTSVVKDPAVGSWAKSEWNEDWSQPLNASSAGRGRGSGEVFRRGCSRDAESGPGFAVRQQQRSPRPADRYINNNDENEFDDNFEGGRWNNPRSQQQKQHSESMSNSRFVDSASKTLTRTFENSRMMQAPAAGSSSRYSDTNRERFLRPQNVSSSFSNSVNQRPPPTTAVTVRQQMLPQQQQRMRLSSDDKKVPMPSNAAECIVYSVDDCDNVEKPGKPTVEDDGFISIQQRRPRSNVAASQQPQKLQNADPRMPSYAAPADVLPISNIREPTLASSSNADMLAKLLQIGKTTETPNKQPQQQRQPVKAVDNDHAGGDEMCAALRELEKLSETLSIELPPEEEFPGDDALNVGEVADNRALESIAASSSSQAANYRNDFADKLALLTKRFGQIDFVSGGFLTNRPRPPPPPVAVTHQTFQQFQRPQPPRLPPLHDRSAHSVTVAGSFGHGGNMSASVGAPNYYQVPQNVMPPHVQHLMQQQRQQEDYNRQLQQQQQRMQHMHHAAAMQHQQQQQQLREQQVALQQHLSHYGQYPPRGSAYAEPAFDSVGMRAPVQSSNPYFVQPPGEAYTHSSFRPGYLNASGQQPSAPGMFAAARGQVLAVGSRGALYMPPAEFAAEPSQSPLRPATMRPPMSMIPRSALLRNSITRKPEAPDNLLD